MKTKEEILKECVIKNDPENVYSNSDWDDYMTNRGKRELPAILEAMELYASEQIADLKRENEELKVRFQGTTFFDEDNDRLRRENTHLRSLLAMAKEYITVFGMGGETAKQLLADIDKLLQP